MKRSWQNQEYETSAEEARTQCNCNGGLGGVAS